MKRAFLLIAFLAAGLIHLGCSGNGLVKKGGEARLSGVQVHEVHARTPAGGDCTTASCGEMPDAAYTMGEAASKSMTLDMKTWIWVYTAYSDGKRVDPKSEGSFRLTFHPGGRVSVRTDCNSMAGSYSDKEGKLIFGDFAATKMYCEGSQETDFSRMLAEISRFFFNSRGELIAEFKHDAGSMTFK